MLANSYFPLINLARTSDNTTGIGAAWIIPIEDVHIFPEMDPTTMHLDSNISLKPNKNWYGPLKVNNSQLEFEEQFQYQKPGHFYTKSIDAYLYGHSSATWFNMDKLPYHRYIMVVHLRNNSLNAVIGSIESPLFVQASYVSGKNGQQLSRHKLTFITENFTKAFLLNDFFKCSQSADGTIVGDYNLDYSNDFN
jgi:hypothetical protein